MKKVVCSIVMVCASMSAMSATVCWEADSYAQINYQSDNFTRVVVTDVIGGRQICYNYNDKYYPTSSPSHGGGGQSDLEKCLGAANSEYQYCKNDAVNDHEDRVVRDCTTYSRQGGYGYTPGAAPTVHVDEACRLESRDYQDSQLAECSTFYKTAKSLCY